MLLWDCDERSYSYFIEVSNNEKDWEVVWDRSKVPCRSWQTITFPRRPIVYIRIVGTYNTANEVFHCVHFECPAISTCTKSLGNNEQEVEERDINAASPSSGASEGDDVSSSTSENLQEEGANFKQPRQRYVQVVADSGISGISYHNTSTIATSRNENRPFTDSRSGNRADNTRSASKGKKRDKRSSNRQNASRNIQHPSSSNRKHIRNEMSISRPPTVGTGITSDITSSRASVITVATALDDVASTVANPAEQEEEQQQILQGAEDEVLDTASVANADGDLADVNDATETQSQISHHSSPASYAGSISGHSTAGISANNSLPVGASACSMARQSHQEQLGYKPIPQGLGQQPNSNSAGFNLRILSQQPPMTEPTSSNIIQSSVNASRHTQHDSPQGSASPISSPSSPAPNDPQMMRQSNVCIFIYIVYNISYINS